METVFDVHARGVKIKKFKSRCCNDASSTKKRSWKNTCVGMHAHGELFVSHGTMLERILKNINSKNED